MLLVSEVVCHWIEVIRKVGSLEFGQVHKRLCGQIQRGRLICPSHCSKKKKPCIQWHNEAYYPLPHKVRFGVPRILGIPRDARVYDTPLPVWVHSTLAVAKMVERRDFEWFLEGCQHP
ncbi:hypothetical protein TNCV_691011 [Trichonephila clavipes]|nr:hypothetical protein TNCV_691011 [Trichonephila clavipes]